MHYEADMESAPRIAALSLCMGPALAQQILYVDANLTTGANDGSTWTNAFQGTLGLKDALAVSNSNTHIYLVEGTYKPTVPDGSRLGTHSLDTGVSLFRY